MTRRLAPIAVILVLSFLLPACGEEPPDRRPRPVRSLVVGDVVAFQERSLPGRAKATQEVDMAFEVSGQLIERPVNVGDPVEPGQILARLDPRDYEARLLSAQGAYRTAKANYERAEALVAEDAMPEIVRDERRAIFDLSAGELRQAEKAVADTKLLAPFAGTVSATYVDNFQNVRAKEPVIRLLDVSKMEMTVDVPEGSIGFAPYIKDVIVRFDALADREFHARIKEVSNEASRTTRTYPVTLIFDPPEDGAVLAGMAGHASPLVELPEDLQSSGIEVPVSAVFSPPEDSSQASYVWVLEGEPPTSRRREVTVLDTTPRGVRIQGLAPGERIATAGVHYLRDGQEARILEPGS